MRNRIRRVHVMAVGCLAVLAMGLGLVAPGLPVAAEGAATFWSYLPVLHVPPEPAPPPLDCSMGASYDVLSVNDYVPPSRPADQHADLNLGLRSYHPNSAALTLVDYNGDRDPAAPQLYGLFADARTPSFVATHRVYQWDWVCNCRAESFEPAHDFWPVSFLEMGTSRGEHLLVPNRLGGEISAEGHKVLVLYAAEDRITLKYTREDSVLGGYSLHIEPICVDPALLARYVQANTDGRTHLPALYGGQAVGVATGGTVGVAIRDGSGSWMDPRARKDWWYGR